jgi:hypothetical protein
MRSPMGEVVDEPIERHDHIGGQCLALQELPVVEVRTVTQIELSEQVSKMHGYGIGEAMGAPPAQGRRPVVV